MHNILSHNQLAGWKQSVMRLENTLDRSMEESDLINDYYNCLIECDDDQSTCKRICRRILRQFGKEGLTTPLFLGKIRSIGI